MMSGGEREREEGGWGDGGGRDGGETHLQMAGVVARTRGLFTTLVSAIEAPVGCH